MRTTHPNRVDSLLNSSNKLTREESDVVLRSAERSLADLARECKKYSVCDRLILTTENRERRGDVIMQFCGTPLPRCFDHFSNAIQGIDIDSYSVSCKLLRDFRYPN